MAAFCFRRPHFGLNRCILLRRAAFCVTRPWLPLDHHSKLQKKVFCIVQWMMCIATAERRDGSILGWDVFISPPRMLFYIFSKGQSPFWTAKCDVFPWIMSDISPELVDKEFLLKNPFQNTLSYFLFNEQRAVMAVRLTSWPLDFRFLSSNPGSDSPFLIGKDRYDRENLYAVKPIIDKP